jgi:hypothetical protein
MAQPHLKSCRRGGPLELNFVYRRGGIPAKSPLASSTGATHGAPLRSHNAEFGWMRPQRVDHLGPFRRNFCDDVLPSLKRADTTVMTITHDSSYFDALTLPARRLHMDEGRFAERESGR